MKISMYVAIRLDGFIAKPDGSIDWLTQEASQTDLENDADCCTVRKLNKIQT